jgi:hypothetical protein
MKSTRWTFQVGRVGGKDHRSSLTYATHLACDVTVGRRVRRIPEAFLEVDMYASTTIHYSIHFRRGVQHKLGQEMNPCLHSFARFLGSAIFQSHAFNMTVQPQLR